MITCDNSTIDCTTSHGDIPGFYACHDLYDGDDIAMKICFSACGGQKHNYASLGYFCAYSQNFDFTTGNGIDYYNLPSATLDDAVISDSGRKDTLSINLTISKFILLWTASIIMIAAFVLYLSTTASTTIKVGMKDISTGLVEVFGMIRTNLLVERLIFERKSGGATINYQRGNEVVYGSCSADSAISAE